MGKDTNPRRVAENEAMAKGINNGIAYLAFIPYLIVFVLIFFDSV